MKKPIVIIAFTTLFWGGGIAEMSETSGRDVEYEVQPSNPGGNLAEDQEHESTEDPENSRDVEYDVKPSDPG